MNSQELENFRLSDAVKFHDSLNPALFRDDKLLPEVRERMLEIARDFIEHLGIKNVEVKDITLSGSNAAFTYTPHSDIDIHILVDIDRYSNDEVYRELFNSKKIIYNDTHDIKIHGYDVELYVQDTAEPVKSLGEYSIERDRWIKFPGKTKSNLDERATREKFKRLVQLSQLALSSDDFDDVDRLLDTIKRYRKAGLDTHGEFGPENLAYKAMRSRGIVQKLYDHRDELHARNFDLSESEPDEYAPPGAPDADVLRLKQEIQKAMRVREPLVWKRPRDIGIAVTDRELQKFGLRKHSVTGNWAGKQSQWDAFYNANNLEEQAKYPELAPYKEIEFVTPPPEYNDVLKDVQDRLYHTIKRIPGVITLYQEYSDEYPGVRTLRAIYKDINLRPTILKLANQFGMPVESERRVSWDYAKRAQQGEFQGQIIIEKTVSKLDKKTLNVKQLAKKHGVSTDHLLSQLKRGIRIELEHTSDLTVAKEIALDHLGEDPDYYTKLKKAELEESFDQPYPLKWERSDYGDYDALAKLDDGTFLSIMFNNEYKKNWMVEFYRNNSQQVTGEGDAQRIFATVLHAIGQFIKKKKPTSLFFSAVKEDDPTGSRSKLYDRLVQRYASSLGYTVRKQEEPGSTSFKLVRRETVKEGASVPNFLYHLTPKENLSSIKQHGLLPEKSRGYSGIYLSQDKAHTLGYIGSHESSDYVLLTIDTSKLNQSKLESDDVDFPDILNQEDPDLDYNDYSWVDSLEMSGQCKYTGVIPPSAIVKVEKSDLQESASGYIPSNAEKNDPRFKTALTIDIKPDSIKKNAKKLGLGNIHRSGIPQTARSDGRFK